MQSLLEKKTKKTPAVCFFFANSNCNTAHADVPVTITSREASAVVRAQSVG
jgi:hypothetical protein